MAQLTGPDTQLGTTTTLGNAPLLPVFQLRVGGGGAVLCHVKPLLSGCTFCVHLTTRQQFTVMFYASHVSRVHVCLAVTCSLHFRHNDWDLLLFSCFFIVPCGKFRLQEQHYPFLPVCAVFSCVQTMVWLPVFGILMHAVAHGCTETVDPGRSLAAPEA